MCSSCVFFWYISSMVLPPFGAVVGMLALLLLCRGRFFCCASMAERERRRFEVAEMKLTQRKRKACVVFEFEFLDLGGSFDSAGEI